MHPGRKMAHPGFVAHDKYSDFSVLNPKPPYDRMLGNFPIFSPTKNKSGIIPALVFCCFYSPASLPVHFIFYKYEPNKEHCQLLTITLQISCRSVF